MELHDKWHVGEMDYSIRKLTQLVDSHTENTIRYSTFAVFSFSLVKNNT